MIDEQTNWKRLREWVANERWTNDWKKTKKMGHQWKMNERLKKKQENGSPMNNEQTTEKN